MNQLPRQYYEFGLFRLDAKERLLQQDGVTISLTPKAFDLLLALVERHGRLVEKEELFQTVWPDSFVEESNLSSHIATIRKALGEGENGLKLIETVAKRGYRFMAEVRVVRPAESQQVEPNGTSLPVNLTVPVVQTSGWRNRIGWIATGALALIALALGMAYVRHPVLNAEPMRFSITPPENAKLFDWPTISPDGRTLAFIAEVDGKTELWVRPLDTTTARPLVEVSSVRLQPFWSPDSQFIGYADQGKVKKIALVGGTPETLCEMLFGGGTWNRDGIILVGGWSTGIRRVSAQGGTISNVTDANTAGGDSAQLAPVFLPDGHHFLYCIENSDPAKSGIYLATLEGQEKRRLFVSDARNVGVVANAEQNRGYLTFVRQGALMAQPFDFRRNELAAMLCLLQNT
jgi:DNA-binding winged helix-turn-helix (wHTH) protein